MMFEDLNDLDDLDHDELQRMVQHELDHAAHVLRLNKLFDAVCVELGKEELDLNLTEQAIGTFTTVIERNPENAVAYYWRARAYAVDRQEKKAQSDAAHARDLDSQVEATATAAVEIENFYQVVTGHGSTGRVVLETYWHTPDGKAAAIESAHTRARQSTGARDASSAAVDSGPAEIPIVIEYLALSRLLDVGDDVT